MSDETVPVEAVRDPDMDERVPADARWWRCQACGICPRTTDGCGEFEAWLYRDPCSGWSLEFGRESECMSVGASFGVAHCPWCGRRLEEKGVRE